MGRGVPPAPQAPGKCSPRPGVVRHGSRGVCGRAGPVSALRRTQAAALPASFNLPGARGWAHLWLREGEGPSEQSVWATPLAVSELMQFGGGGRERHNVDMKLS